MQLLKTIGSLLRHMFAGTAVIPPFEDMLQQDAVWAIKAYLETKRVK